MEDKLISQQFPGSTWPRSNGNANEVLVAVNFRVPFDFRQRMKLSATVRGVTMTELMTAALEYYLENVPATQGGAGSAPDPRLGNFRGAAILGSQR